MRDKIGIAAIGAIATIIVAIITTYGTIAVSKPESLKVKKDLEKLSELEKIANLPIATIVPSVLKPALFSEAVGDPPVFNPIESRFVIADGRTDITISRYGKLLAVSKTPDLRAMFLRGVNLERADEYADPDKNRNAGDTQMCATKRPSKQPFVTDQKGEHLHGLSLNKWNPQLGPTKGKGRVQGNVGANDAYWTDENVSGNPDNEWSGRNWMNPSGKHTHDISDGGDQETRPNNVAVFFYLKIN